MAFQNVLLLSALALSPSVAHPPCAVSNEQADPLLLESQLLATLPDGMSLDFPVQQYGSLTYQPPRVVRWSPNGRSVAYIGLKKSKRWAVQGDKPLGDFDFIQGPYFGLESSQCLFRVGDRTSKTKEKWSLLLDGKKLLKEDWIGTPVISEEGDLIAVWTQPGARVDANGAYNIGSQVLTILEQSGRSWKTRESKHCPDALSLVEPAIDGDRVLTAAKLDESWATYGLVTMERGKRKKLELLAELTGTAVHIGAAGSGKDWGVTIQSVVDLASGASRCTALLNGEPVDREADETYGPYFSSVDKRRAIRVREGKRYGVELIGEDRDPEYDYVSEPTFGPDKQIAFVAVDGAKVSVELGMNLGMQAVEGGEQFVVRRQGKGEDQLEPDRWDEIRWIQFSPDGEHLAYAARRGDRWQMILDGTPSADFDDVGHPRFSEDSETLVFGARTDRELWWRVFTPK